MDSKMDSKMVELKLPKITVDVSTEMKALKQGAAIWQSQSSLDSIPCNGETERTEVVSDENGSKPKSVGFKINSKTNTVSS